MTQTITPWDSALDAIKTGPLPALPADTSYSMLKGSICSTIVEPSPWNPDEHSLRLTCSDNELKAPTPSGRTPPSSSSNPGVMACGPQRQFTSGTVAYTRWRFLVPSEFPELIPNAFCLLGEPVSVIMYSPSRSGYIAMISSSKRFDPARSALQGNGVRLMPRGGAPLVHAQIRPLPGGLFEFIRLLCQRARLRSANADPARQSVVP